MAKVQAGWKLDERTIDLVRSFSAFLRVTQVRLVCDAVTAVARMHHVASGNHNSVLRELHRRYGPAATIKLRIVEAADGEPEGQVLIDGEQREDVRVHLVLEPERFFTHTFLEVRGHEDDGVGTVRVGHDVLLTRPLLAAGRLPWPVDPATSIVGRLDELMLVRDEAVSVP